MPPRGGEGKIIRLASGAAPDKSVLMKWMRLLVAIGVSVAFFGSLCQLSAADPAKIRVLVITGGHDFEQPQFFKLFQDNAEISYVAVEHPKAQAWFKKDAAKGFDVIVAYDMHQEISDEAKADFLALLKEGKGLVVLHHAIASYQQWPDYANIIGARYYLDKTVVNGVEKPASIWQHDVKIAVQVADKAHPITKGVSDFQIHDETYKLFDVSPEVHPLLTTKEPLSNPVIGWCKTHGPARVVYFQGGHDHFAYENPNFQTLLRQAIRWAAQR